MADVYDSGSVASNNGSSTDWAAAAMNAFGEVASAAISNGEGRRSQKRARRYNEELMRIQDELNDQNALDAYNRSLEAWNLQNEYNSPLSQRERLEQAGLNAALLYGSNAGASVGTAGGLSPVTSSTVGVGSVSPLQPVVYGNIGKTIAEIDLLKSQANRNDAEAEDLRGETQPAKARMSVDTLKASLLKQQVISQEQANDITAFENQRKKKWLPSNYEEQNRLLTRRAEIALEELVSARNENALYPKKVEELNATIENIYANTQEKRALAALARVQATNEKYDWQNLKPQMLQRIKQEIDIMKTEQANKGYEGTLLQNAIRDYDANWWNATLQGWLGSVFSGGQAAASLYSSTVNGK